MRTKFLLLTVIIVISGFLKSTFAQTIPASATWPLLSTTLPAPGSGITSGPLTATDELFSTLSINAYTGGGSALAQRLRINSVYPPETAVGWPTNKTAAMNDVYVQFSVTPKTGNKFTVDSVGLSICGMSIATAKADIYYSTDPTFATATQIPYTTGLTSGTSTNVLSSSTLLRVKASSLNITVNPGQTFYIRAYPWIEGLSSPNATKYFCIQNVVIAGQSESLPVTSSVVWPCVTTDLPNVITGNMLAGTPIFNNLVEYGSTLAYGGVNGVSFYTNAIWQAETAPAEGRYVQFSASPKTLGTLVVDSISLKMAAWYTNDFRVSIYYSKDPNFTLATGTALIQDVVVVNAAFTKTKVALNLTVNSGETIYVRLYPYHLSVSGDKNKLIGLNDVSIFGTVTGVSADPPTVTTTAVTYISKTFATSGGNVPSDGGASVTDRGVVWNTTGTPTITDSKLASGTGSGSFTAQIKGLTDSTKYYLRAYATNSAGTSYGSEISFTTLHIYAVPTVTTTVISSIMAKTATSGGNVTAWGGDTIVARGICWNTSSTPTTTNNFSVDGNGLGSFTSGLINLAASTTYYVRAYATSKLGGTGYGNEISFTTQAIAPDVIKVVAKDGSGDYTTIQAAFNAVPLNYTGRYIFNIKPGTYYEKDTLAANKVNVILKGIHPDSTIITYNAFADSPKPGGTMGTNGCFSVGINGNDFTAINITFQNTIKNDGTHGSNEQAVALFTNADRLSFYNCKLLGYQDTYYAGGGSNMGRIYMKNCYIEGSVDFIFGNATTVFDSCEMHVNRDGGPVTAPSTNAASTFGYVFRNGKITAEKVGFNGVTIAKIYLGRPWQNAPKSVYISCEEPAVLAPEGWTVMQVNPGLFAEYKCTGPGFSPTTRSTNPASAGRQLTDAEAANYTLTNIFARTTNPAFGWDWMPDLTIYKLSQTISFGSIGAKKADDVPFKLAVSATSKLPLTFASSDTTVAKVSHDTITIVGKGSATITASQAGNYLYSAAPNAVQTLTVGPGTGITELKTSDIKIYPNPASSVISIDRKSSAPATFLIFDSRGQKVIEKNLTSEKVSIDITSLPKGIYIIKLQDLTYKLVVQ